MTSESTGGDGGEPICGDGNGPTDNDSRRPRAAVFRPDDERLCEAVETLDALGIEAVADPMLAIEETGDRPGPGASDDTPDVVVFTSKTGAEIAARSGWEPGETTVVAIGPATADALRAAGYAVDRVPDDYASSGLVAELRDDVDGRTVEVARSDHGSDVLIEGLDAAGATVVETVLYRLSRPSGAGHSAERVVTGDVDAVLFTSSLTVAHFLEAATDRDIADAVRERLNGNVIVGAIGTPTAETAADLGVEVDVVPDESTFVALAESVAEALDRE